jgi:UDP-3-O-[3-hydroxymyristoyl] glucosamine N-acyltransferase
MKNYEAIGTGIFVHKDVRIGKNVSIGHGSCIGFGDPKDGELIIEDNVKIGAFCVIHFGVVIRESAYIDHKCVIGIEAEIGRNTQILSGKEITYRAKIGNNCIIGGNVADRTIIEDNVTYFGEIAHSYRDASRDWNTTEEPSPIIYEGSVIGVNAIIIGPRKIGPYAYIGAGEIVRTDIGESIALMKGEMKPLSAHRGMFKSRCK